MLSKDDILIDIFTFSDWQPDSIEEITTELNDIGASTSPKVVFLLDSKRPDLPPRASSEWLDREQIVAAIFPYVVSERPSVVLTKHRLNLDYFGDTFPQDGVAVITTYNNYALPRDILEKQYLLYSFTYCIIDLIADPNLWHAETRGCIFDQVLAPSEIAEGLRSSAICDICNPHLSKLTEPRESTVIAYVERLLAKLGTRPASKPKATKGRGTPHLTSPPVTNLGNTKGGFLVVDRASMRRALHHRFDVEVDDTFADNPDEIRTVLDRVTTKMMGHPDSSAKRVEDLVRLNHTTDIFYLDVDKRHRDHSLHQLYVALFGFELLDINIPHIHNAPKFQMRYTPFRDFLASKLNVPRERADWTWYVTAILHDHAYPLSALLSRIARYLRISRNLSSYGLMGARLKGDVDFYRPLMAPPLAALVDEALLAADDKRPNADEFEEKYVDMLRNALATSLNVREIERKMPSSRYDHGVIGAANLALWTAGDRPPYIEKVCYAIFEHNLEDELVLESQPLSFLLKLCDTLQEWDRIVYPSGGPPIRESEKIEIGPFHKKHKSLRIEESLKVRFTFTRKEVLDQSGWDPDRFRDGTRRHLRLLKNNAQAFVQVDEMEVDYVQSI